MQTLHHVHIFASDLQKSIAFYRDNFGGEIVLDTELAGARNVFMKIGTGRIHFYQQLPKSTERGAVHHIGIQTDEIEQAVEKLKLNGVEINNEIKEFGLWKYIMVPAPDNVLIELFQVDFNMLPRELQSYFK
jgi:catechol 2,3-dioxygenase-like lactoylglutathione lyase family enzyme